MRIGEWGDKVLSLTLVICAVTITALIVRRELIPSANAKRPDVLTVKDWPSYTKAGHREGLASAAVQIVVFSDFQCPACRVLAQQLQVIRKQYPADVAVLYRHLPLPYHPFAVDAVRASECAAQQGSFSKVHDALFAEQQAIGLQSWAHFATIAKVPDIDRFTSCVEERGLLPVLARDTIDAKRLRISATPGYLINERRYQGTPPLDILQKEVANALASSHERTAARRPPSAR